jgi:hypothetical protein
MNNEHKPSRISHVPAILAGSAALVAALSTLYVNLRGEPPAPEAPVVAVVAPTVAPAPPEAAPAPTPPTGPRTLNLRLDRVQVDNDGSVGTTDWTFQVSADEQPLFTVPMPSLNDKPGHNLAKPADAAQAAADVEVPSGKSVSIKVSGWKKRLLPGTPAELSGSDWMTLGLGKTVVTLEGAKPGGPKFVLYFSATESR